MKAAALVLLAAAYLQAQIRETVFQEVTVKKGDTLWSIANAYLKDPAKWDELLKYNKLPADPTVTLPGMKLKVPVELIREDLRAAHLVQKVRRVDFRRKDTANWSGATQDQELFKGDALRTLEDGKAKVKFLNADMLNVDSNSLVIIKPPRDGYDVELKSGSIFTGRSRVITASARVTPKTGDTQYSTQITPDFTTVVAVHKGLAAVEAQGRTVDVKAGMATQVKMGLAPETPRDIPDLPNFEARAAEFNAQPIRRQANLQSGAVAAKGAVAEEIERAADAADIRGEVSSLRIGMPISGFRVQASLTREFQQIAFDKTYDADARLDMRYERIQPGVYWVRIAMVDLLGSLQKWSEPRLYSIGGAARRPQQQQRSGSDLLDSVKIAKPAGDENINGNPNYKVVGVVKNDRVTVKVNGRQVRQDDQGNFTMDLRLKEGINNVEIVVADPDGTSTSILRRLTFRP